MAFPDNLPKGSYFGDGLRGGPTYSGYYVPGGQPDPTLPNYTPPTFVPANFEKWGKGILYSPQQTYRMNPYPSAVGNVVATQTIVLGDLPLGGGLLSTINQATRPITLNGQTAIQFDWPRGVSITVAGGNGPVGGCAITVFGNDVYGVSMQKTFQLGNGTGTGAVPGTYFTSYATGSQKAFYQITRVASSASFTGPSTFSLQTNEIFGMPYKIADWSVITGFNWAGQNMRDQYGYVLTAAGGTATITTPAVGSVSAFQARNPIFATVNMAQAGTVGSSVTVANAINYTSFLLTSQTAAAVGVGWRIQDGGQNLFQFADTTAPSTTTGDVRGMFALPSTQTADGTAAGTLWPTAAATNNIQYIRPNVTASINAVITSYTFGSDNFQNQLAASGQPIGALNSGNTVPYLSETDLLGLPQFYSGVAS